MTQDKPRIASLKPVVFEDQRRVTLEMVVQDLPSTISNIMFMPDLSDTPPTRPPKPEQGTTSPYPNVELSILDSRRQQVASLFIVEHKEMHTSLTLHLSSPDPQEHYIARAEMTFNDKTIDVVEVPFVLNQAD